MSFCCSTFSGSRRTASLLNRPPAVSGGRVRLSVAADEPAGYGLVDEAEVDVCERNDVLRARDELRRITGALRATRPPRC